MTTVRAKSLHLKPSGLPGAAAADDSRLFALIPCAGHGSRAGTIAPKQYEMLGGEVMVRHTVEAFRALSDTLAGIWVVVSPGDTRFGEVFGDFGQAPEVLLAQGGETRAATVLNGLKAMLAAGHENGAVADDWVLVHDAARCLITPAQIMTLIKACRHDPVGGLLAQPLPDTLKSASSGRAELTIGRSDKWLAQTPQMFRIGMLIAALESAGDVVTDESSAIEASGLSPRLVAGSAQNFKVTFPEDFALAEAVLHSRRERAAAAAPVPVLQTLLKARQ